MKSTRIAAALAALALASAAQAHQVWLEPDGSGVKLYFGEFAENLREASPGLLDKFGTLTAASQGRDGGEAVAVPLVKTANGFAIARAPRRGEALVAEDAVYPIMERKDGDRPSRMAYAPAARLVTDFHAAVPARLTLDLVPTGAVEHGRVELQASFRGQPLTKAKVAVLTRSGWMQELYTDDAGKVRVQMPWAGTYVLELHHDDKTAGTRANGDAYDHAAYVTSVTLVQPRGRAELPAPPAAKPN